MYIKLENKILISHLYSSVIFWEQMRYLSCQHSGSHWQRPASNWLSCCLICWWMPSGRQKYVIQRSWYCVYSYMSILVALPQTSLFLISSRFHSWLMTSHPRPFTTGNESIYILTSDHFSFHKNWIVRCSTQSSAQ